MLVAAFLEYMLVLNLKVKRFTVTEWARDIRTAKHYMSSVIYHTCLVKLLNDAITPLKCTNEPNR